MIPSLRLTWCLLRIPRLVAILLLAPVITAVMLAVLQFFGSAIFLRAPSHQSAEMRAEKLEARAKDQDPSWFRKTLIGNADFARELKTCFWEDDPVTQTLRATSPDCALERFDIVISPAVTETFGLPFYQNLFKGLFRAIHICDGCGTDIIIRKENGKMRTDFRSFLGFVLFQEVNFRGSVEKKHIEALQARKELGERLGDRFFDLVGFREPTKLSSLSAKIVIILNIGFAIVTALWLALKAHRRVLDYLSHSGVLLPMVAAVGKSPFYGSVWLLTLIRVAAFVLATVPLGIFVFIDVITDPSAFPFYGRPFAFFAWALAVIISFALAALVASVAELKHHHDLFNIHYKLAPLIACSFGGIVWTVTFLVELPIGQTVRSLIGAIPVVGIGPILLAPVFEPYWYVLAANIVSTLVLLIWVGRYNTRWFAAHLDEI